MNKGIIFLLKHRKFLIGIVHIFLMAGAYFFAFFLRFEFNFHEQHFHVFFETLFYLIFIKSVIFYFFRIYEGLWRYVSIYDVFQILKANFVATLAFFAYISAFYGLEGYPRSVFLIDFILCISFLCGIRFLSRWIRERHFNFSKSKKERVLIIGAGEAGIITLRELLLNAYYNVVGFIDDDLHKKNGRISGLKVIGTTDEIEKIIEKYLIDEVIISIPSASGRVIREIILKCEKAKVKIKILPGLNKIISGEITVKDIRDVKAEDLLDRKPISIDTKDVSQFIEGKTFLITGAGGTIGSELCRQVARFNPRQIILYDHDENNIYYLHRELNEKFPRLKHITAIGDIKDIGLLKNIFSFYRPQVVFHSAAHKHVPLLEENPAAAVKNNIIGTRNLMYAAEHYLVDSFVMISTDKAVRPTSVMGASKRLAEMIIQSKSKRSKTKFMAVRFGNVIGSSGSVVPLFKKQIKQRAPVTVTHPEVKRYFMTVEEAILLVLQAATFGNGGEVFILDMGEQIKIIDLAKNLIILSGLRPDKDIEIKYIGLRPGEKMYEEMLLDKEHDQVTKHDKIFIAQPVDFKFSQNQLRREIKEIERLAILMDSAKIITKLKKMVPDYKPEEKN